MSGPTVAPPESSSPRQGEEEPEGDVPDLVMDPEDLDDFRATVAEIFNTSSRCENLLVRIGFRRDRIPSFDGRSADDVWSDIFWSLEMGITYAPYRRLLTAALRAYPGNGGLVRLAERYQPDARSTTAALGYRPAEGQPEERLPDFIMAPQDLDDFRSTLAVAYDDSHRLQRLLEGVGFPRARIPSSDGRSPEEVWTEVFMELDRGIIPTPSRRLLAAALRAYSGNAVFVRLAESYQLSAPSTTTTDSRQLSHPTATWKPTSAPSLGRIPAGSAGDLPDRSRSRAVLIGTSDYTELTPVPAAANSLHRMRTLLTGPLCGWPADRVETLLNEPTPGDLPNRLVGFFEDVADVALFYYVGHGQPDLRDQLCLGLVESRAQAERRAVTSLPFDAVRYALNISRAKTKIVILDCCFAGLAMTGDGALGAVAVMATTAGTGAYTVAASGAYNTAWFETDPDNPAPHTYFTKRLAELVEHGIVGEPATLTLDALVEHLTEDLAFDGKPIPTHRTRDYANRFPFARNTALIGQLGDQNSAGTDIRVVHHAGAEHDQRAGLEHRVEQDMAAAWLEQLDHLHAPIIPLHDAAELEREADSELASALQSLDPQAAANVLSPLEPGEVTAVLSAMDPGAAAALLGRMHPERAVSVLNGMASGSAAVILNETDPGTAATVLDGMNQGWAATALTAMDPERALAVLDGMHPRWASAVRRKMGPDWAEPASDPAAPAPTEPDPRGMRIPWRARKRE